MGKWQEKLLQIALLIVVSGGALQSPAQTASPPATANPTTTDSTSLALPDLQVSWKLLVPNVVHDQKPIWLFPKALAEGEPLKPTIAVLSITGGLIALAPIVSPYFRHT